MPALGLVLLALSCRGSAAFNIAALAHDGVTSGIAIGLILLIAVFLWRYWDRVLMAITGDDRIHMGILDVGWLCFCKCCGLCNGEWTRMCTNCPCCLERIRGKNLVRELGRLTGFATIPIEVKGIVAGDLPFDGRGDFFLSIECGSNPPMVTSLVEECRPKIVHFPEVLTLRIRRSPLEDRVRFVIKELNVLGSNELCELYLSPETIVDWSNDGPEEKIKRICMTALDRSLEWATPPWISFEFAEPHELRELHTMGQYSNADMVRTMNVTNKDGLYITQDMSTFKGAYTLLDGTGNPVAEPDEDELLFIARLRRSLQCVISIINAWGLLFIVAYGSMRFYVWSCYRQFTFLTMAVMHNETMPISTEHLHDLVTHCDHQLTGTGAVSGVPCRPNFNQTLAVCENTPMKRPTAFSALIKQLLGIELEHGIKCFDGICAFRDEIQKYDRPFFIFVIAVPVVSYVLKALGDKMIRSCRRKQQKGQKDGLAPKRATSTAASAASTAAPPEAPA